jgi:GNAT superfamily N-acetyltransferase
MRIRPAEQGDSRRFSELNRRFNGSDARLDERDDRSERVIVAEVGGTLVGFACVRIHRSVCCDSPSAELTELFVEAECRRRGVGAALVSEAERISWKSGCSELVLRTKAGNLAARALFDRCGYEDARHTTYRKRASSEGDGHRA